MKHLRRVLTFSVAVLLMAMVVPVFANAQMSRVKTVWVILMENHNWTGNNAGASFGDPDLKATPCPLCQWDTAEYIGSRRAIFSILQVIIPARRTICGWRQGELRCVR